MEYSGATDCIWGQATPAEQADLRTPKKPSEPNLSSDGARQFAKPIEIVSRDVHLSLFLPEL
jgi:hypothetical protein